MKDHGFSFSRIWYCVNASFAGCKHLNNTSISHPDIVKSCSNFSMKSLILILALATITLASATSTLLQSRSSIIMDTRLQSVSNITKFGTCSVGYYACTDSEGDCCADGTQCCTTSCCTNGGGGCCPNGETCTPGVCGPPTSGGGGGGGGGGGTGGSSGFSSDTVKTQMRLSIELLTVTIVALIYMSGHM